SLHAVDVSALIHFLPTLLNQLFRLLPLTKSEDVAMNTIRVLIHVVSEVHAAGKPRSLQTYVTYVFLTTPVADAKQCTIHEELVRHLKAILLPKQADLLVITKFLRQADFFFKVILKAMAQFLLNTGRIKEEGLARVLSGGTTGMC
ncbi:Dedicator of cytokinesis protein 9, partial [Lamellibrachia satsuma]